MSAHLAGDLKGTAGGVVPLAVVKDKPNWNALAEMSGVSFRTELVNSRDLLNLIQQKKPLRWSHQRWPPDGDAVFSELYDFHRKCHWFNQPYAWRVILAGLEKVK